MPLALWLKCWQCGVWRMFHFSIQRHLHSLLLLCHGFVLSGVDPVLISSLYIVIFFLDQSVYPHGEARSTRWMSSWFGIFVYDRPSNLQAGNAPFGRSAISEMKTDYENYPNFEIYLSRYALLPRQLNDWLAD